MPRRPAHPDTQAPQPSRVRDRPTWLISRNYARSNGLLTDGFAAGGEGLRGYHYRLLAALEEWGPSSQADLARATGIDRSDVVAALGELEGRKAITRAVDPANRRRNVVSITAAGRRTLAALDEVVDKVQEQVLAPLSASERRQLEKLLRKLLA
jgi:MarR family transcriptional regulator, lower aerobic nicotinate degradation pathway regulator